MIDTIQHDITGMEEDTCCSADREKNLFSPRPDGMLSLSGGNSLMTQARKESTAAFLGMNLPSSPLTLSERLTPLLVSAGLVNGTTRTFGLRLLNQGIQAGVLFAPDGSIVDIPKQDCLF
jgi:hypothetical protein